MDVRAIILVGAPTGNRRALEGNGAQKSQFAAGTISQIAMPLLPVLGRSLVVRTAEELAKAGVDKVSVLNAASRVTSVEQEALAAQVNWKNVSLESLWRAAEEEFSELAQDGAELVIVLRMGAYAEIDLDEVLQFHIDQRSRVTQLFDAQGPLDLFVISSSRRNDAAHLFRAGLAKSRASVRGFELSGYVNRLEEPADFRRLTLDSLSLKTALRPIGKQIRPGIWRGDGAKIDRGARIVAPAYIGAYSRVRNSALVTRGSAIEHHCVIDCGTAVDNSTVLPFSYIGPGLDLCNSILGFQQVTSLKRAATVAIEDPKLIKAISQTAALRLLEQTAELISYLPQQLWRGLSRRQPAAQPGSIADTTSLDLQHFDPPLGGECASKDSKVFDNDLAVARRYGNQ